MSDDVVNEHIVDQATYDAIARRLAWPPHPPPKDSDGA